MLRIYIWRKNAIQICIYVYVGFDFAAGDTPAAAIEQVERDLRPFHVEAVQVEIGVGSPIPVDIIVNGSWPDPCAHLAEVNQTIEGNHFSVDILASPAGENCPPDYVGLPFRIVLPLNMVEMAPDTYSIDVNGVESTFEWLQDESESPEGGESASHVIAYIGQDGNQWIGSLHGMNNRHITTDTTRLTGGIASDLEVI